MRTGGSRECAESQGASGEACISEVCVSEDEPEETCSFGGITNGIRVRCFNSTSSKSSASKQHE